MLLVVLVVSGCAEIFGEGPGGSNSRLVFNNETSGTITVTYELAPEHLDESDLPQSLLIPPGSRDSLRPSPQEDHCTVAPVIVTNETNGELLRLPPGYCYGDAVHDNVEFDIEEG